MSTPSNQSLLSIELLAKQVVEGFITGLHKSPFHGFSVEFAEHKPYNLGASTKNIDWKLYARTDKLYTKHYDEETNLQCRFIVDISPSMCFPEEEYSKLKFSLLGVASMISLLQKQRDAFGLITFADTIQDFTEIKSTQVHKRFLLQLLEELYTNPIAYGKSGTALADSLHQVADQQKKRSLIVIFSDFMDSDDSLEGLFSAFRHLQFNRHDVVLFNVLHQKMEYNFDLPNRPLLIQDAETLQKVKVFPEAIKEKYQEAFMQRQKTIREKAFQYKIDWNDAFIEKGHVYVLNNFLLKRQRMLNV